MTSVITPPDPDPGSGLSLVNTVNTLLSLVITTPDPDPGSVAIIASTELKRERVNNLIQVITDSVGHPAHHHELVRHRVHVIHLELGDAGVQAGVEEVHDSCDSLYDSLMTAYLA